MNIKVTADEDNAEKGLNRLIAVLERVNKATQSTSGKNSRYAQTVERVQKATEKATKAHEGLFKRIGNFTTRINNIYIALDRYANRLKAMYQASNEFIETRNLFDVTMRQNAASALKYAESVESIMGIDLSEWMNFQGTFKQLASGFGVANDQATVMSKNLTQLSYDLASLFNVSNETAFDKLSSAMTGQVKGLRQFGIDTTNASLQEYALAKEIDLAVSKMTQAQKSVLRYNYILEKSIKIQGDLARTVQTPANSIRILSALIERFQRALGNVISVIVTKFIPYIQAATMLLTDWANQLAEAWGFELPTIDYSGLDTASTYLEDIEDETDAIADSIDDATAAAKKFKYQLMGFDELNILKSPTDDSSSKSSSFSANTYPTDLGLGIPEYDFGLDNVSSQAKAIYDKLKKFFDLPFIEKLKAIHDWINNKLPKPVQNLIKFFAALFAIKGALKLIGGLKTIWGLLKVSAVGKYFSAFVKGWKNADSGTSRFMSGVENAQGSLTKLQKVAGVAASTIVGYFSSKDFFYKLKSDSLDAGSAIMDVTGMVGSLAMGFATGGWIGLAITAVGELAGAFIGLSQAQDEARKKLVEESFYDGVGVPITQISDKVVDTMNSISTLYSTYNEKFSELSSNKADIETICGNINSIGSAISNNVMDVDIGTSDLGDMFDKLEEKTTLHCQGIYIAVSNALAGSVSESLESVGFDTELYLKTMAAVADNMNTEALEIIDQQRLLKDELASGNIDKTEFYQQLGVLQNKYDEIMGTSTDLPDIIDEFGLALEDVPEINWLDDSSIEKGFSAITDATQTATDKVTEYYNNLITETERARNRLDPIKDKDDWINLGDFAAQLRTAKSNALSDINGIVDSYIIGIEEHAMLKVDKAKGDWEAKIENEWNTNNWLQFMWHYDKDAYRASELEKYMKDMKTDTIDKVSGHLEDLKKQLGIEGKRSLSEAFDAVMGDFFINDMDGHIVGLNNWENSMAQGFSVIGGASGDGYLEGFQSKISAMKSKAVEGMKETQTAAKIADDQHSPSHIWEGFGVNSAQGYINGFASRKTKAVETVRNFSETIHKEWQNSSHSFISAFDELFNPNVWAQKASDVSSAIKNNLKLPTIRAEVGWDNRADLSEFGYSSLPNIKFNCYASGGFPEMGEMFIARESGAELVGQINGRTAVVNNEQIVESISRAVYSAFMAANQGSSTAIHIVNEIDGEVVTEKVITHHNNMVQSTGMSPLLI